MQPAFETSQKSKLHESLDFVITENSLRRSLTASSRAEELRIGFCRFSGLAFPDMPRAGVTYYPVLAAFRLDPGRRYRTFDQYQVDGGTTVLVYPVNRQCRRAIRGVLMKIVIPAIRAWLEDYSTGHQKAESFYAVYDQTFDELIFGPNKIAGAKTGWRLRFVEKSQVVLSFRPAQLNSRLAYKIS